MPIHGVLSRTNSHLRLAPAPLLHGRATAGANAAATSERAAAARDAAGATGCGRTTTHRALPPMPPAAGRTAMLALGLPADATGCGRTATCTGVAADATGCGRTATCSRRCRRCHRVRTHRHLHFLNSPDCRQRTYHHFDRHHRLRRRMRTRRRCRAAAKTPPAPPASSPHLLRRPLHRQPQRRSPCRRHSRRCRYHRRRHRWRDFTVPRRIATSFRGRRPSPRFPRGLSAACASLSSRVSLFRPHRPASQATGPHLRAGSVNLAISIAFLPAGAVVANLRGAVAIVGAEGSSWHFGEQSGR